MNCCRGEGIPYKLIKGEKTMLSKIYEGFTSFINNLKVSESTKRGFMADPLYLDCFLAGAEWMEKEMKKEQNPTEPWE